ncbi:Holliday junction DNA helicase RuvA [Peptoniphilus olsenii]|uniref:Holliday junction branch migration complex subunit RuvA n=1 Tax=Peptoniphilus olsenii TaxID=411570 RepID=A0ABV2J6M2_9FIRM
MLEFIKGKIDSIENNYLVLENGNIGYIIYMPKIELLKLTLNTDVMIYTRLIVREDSITTYGFANTKSRDIFDLLTTVTGIGPKLAMGILDETDVSFILNSIAAEDVKSLTKIPGIGKKTAQRLILELKDKVKNLNIDIPETDIINENINLDKSSALEALISLGYNEYEAKNALENIDDNLDISVMIREALKVMS